MTGALSHINRCKTALTLATLLLMGWLSTACWAQTVKVDTIRLRGAGSTFVAPLFKRWIDEYRVAHRNVAISYDAVGSGEGVKRFLAEDVDFAGSDETLTDSEIGKVRNGAIIVPVTAGSAVARPSGAVHLRSDGSVLSDDLRRALADDDAGRHRIAGGDVRHDRAIRNTQSVDAIDTKLRIDYRRAKTVQPKYPEKSLPDNRS